MSQKRTVVFGLIGPVLDMGRGPSRWERWRPTVALCQHEDLIVDRLELLFERKFTRLGTQVKADIASCSPETEVRMHEVCWDDAWDFVDVYTALHDFARGYAFKPDEEQYLIHITTGTH